MGAFVYLWVYKRIYIYMDIQTFVYLYRCNSATCFLVNMNTKVLFAGEGHCLMFIGKNELIIKRSTQDFDVGVV